LLLGTGVGINKSELPVLNQMGRDSSAWESLGGWRVEGGT